MRHDPPNSHGDCVRACVASLMEMQCENVPHFYRDGNGEKAFDRMRIWLSTHKRIPAYFPLPEHMTLEQVCHAASIYDTDCMLFCSNRGGDHCVIINRDGVAHDPNWYKTEIIGPHSSGVWIVIVLARTI